MQLKSITTGIIIAVFALLPLSPVAAQGLQGGKNLIDTAGKAAYGEGYDTQPGLEETIGGFIRGFLGLLGIIFVILMIYGGYNYMAARGNDEMVEEAKKTIRRAVIGLVIVLMAYAITEFVVESVYEASVSDPESGIEAGGVGGGL